MRQQIFYWWVPFTLLSTLAYFIQTQLYLHKDVAIIMHTAAAMLAGETYTKDIFEPNPPMIFYLSMPAIILAKLMSISALSAIRIYFITLTFISINCCYFIIKKLFKNNTLLTKLFIYVMIYVLLFLPAQQFAQREHFLLVLALPYLLLAALRLENQKLSPMFAIIIGLMAGIGFAIKPHFLPALLFVEAYFIYKKRDILGWIRLETICIIGIFVTYATAIFLFYPQYIHNVLPIWLIYYTTTAHPLLEIVSYPGLIYCFAIIVFYFMTRRLNEYKIICHIFLLALIGLICSYIMPRVAWYYHIFPALGIACLLATIIIGQIFSQIIKVSRTKQDVLLLAMIASIVYFIPLVLSINYLIAANRYFNSETDLSRLMRFFKQNKQNATFDLFAMTHDSIVLEFYTPARYVGSFPFLMWEYNQVILKHDPSPKADAYEKNIPHLVSIISQDLNQKKPKFIIVDIPSSLDYLGIKINYIEKYSQYKHFQTAWKSYRYLRKIGPYEIYERTYN